MAPFERGVREERIRGTWARRSPNGPTAFLGESPVQDLAAEILSPGRGFVGALSRVYGVRLTEHVRQQALLSGMEVGVRFVDDAAYRNSTLHELASKVFDGPALLLVHPPSVLWNPAVSGVDPDLLLCRMLGEIGFGQICDELLRQPIPLLVRPWCPKRGLVPPQQLPPTAFSEALCVERVAPRRMLLFEKRPVCR